MERPLKPRVHLIIERPDGRCSGAERADDRVTPAMLAAAEDLLHTLISGERVPPEGLYDLCATAFGTTRDDAKERLIGAMYGKRGASTS